MSDRTPETEEKGRALETDLGRRRVVTWLWRLPVLAVMVGAGYGLYEAIRILGKDVPGAVPDYARLEPALVASAAEFPEIWSAVTFTYGDVPAVLIRLPGPVSGGLEQSGLHYGAFSRVCTHQGCIVNLNRDLETVAVAFNYRGDHPVLACPCHFSVFDPSEAGEAVSGPAVRPLQRVQLEARGADLYAVGLERI